MICRENCGDKMDAFLSRTYYINGGCGNREGMLKLNALMEQIEVNRDEFNISRSFSLCMILFQH